MNTSPEIDKVAEALAKAQAEMVNPAKSKANPHFKSKYADLAGGLDVVRPVLGKHGLAIVQATEIVDDGVILRTRIAHASGQWIEASYPVGKFGPHQQLGANLTYAKRQSLFALVGIAGEDEDEDGHDAGDAAGKRKPEQSAGHIEAAAYVIRASEEIQKFTTAEELGRWWLQEKKNRQLHFTSSDDPLLKKLKEETAKRSAELTPESEPV